MGCMISSYQSGCSFFSSQDVPGAACYLRIGDGLQLGGINKGITDGLLRGCRRTLCPFRATLVTAPPSNITNGPL